jgi:hypothetical protein
MVISSVEGLEERENKECKEQWKKTKTNKHTHPHTQKYRAKEVNRKR